MGKPSTRKSREFWSALADEYDRAEGMTQREFAEIKEVNVDSFRQWIYRFRAERGDPTLCRKTTANTRVKKTSFVEFELETTPLVTVRVGAISVEFSAVPPPSWIAELASIGGV